MLKANPIKTLWLAATIAILGGCAGLKALQARSTWDEHCYKGFGDDVTVLAGADAKDCSLLHLERDFRGTTSPPACLQKVLPSNAAFRVAHASYGDDSAFCDAAVRTAAGVFYHIWYDADVTGQWRQDGLNAAIQITRCQRMALQPGTIGPGSFFELTECESDHAALDRVRTLQQESDAFGR